MNLSHSYSEGPPVEQGERVLLDAVDAGVTLFDTAAVYGFGANEELVGRVLKAHRQKITLCSKGGMVGIRGEDGVTRRVIDSRPESVLSNCEDSLRRLQTDVIDVYYLHRWDKKVPIEECVGAMSRLVEQGKVRTIGLSEVSAATLLKAHAVHPITAVQSEYSLWTRNPEIAVLATCREIGATFVAYSPIARGALSETLQDLSKLEPNDFRLAMPRLQPANHAENLKLIPGFKALAQEAGCTPVQLALAWLLHMGGDIIPLTGTTSTAHLRENLGAIDVQLSRDLISRLDAHINQRTVHGHRLAAPARSEVDSEDFQVDEEPAFRRVPPTAI